MIQNVKINQQFQYKLTIFLLTLLIFKSTYIDLLIEITLKLIDFNQKQILKLYQNRDRRLESVIGIEILS